MAKLFAKTVKIPQLDPALRDQMYDLMSNYYDYMAPDRFVSDLNAKDEVILLFDTAEKRLRGFSTLKRVTVTGPNGKPIRAMYSGDTVVERAFWGQKVLGVEFLKILWKEKVKNPFQPLYWLLISKGYKTYLLLANNVDTHYPRFEEATPAQMQSSMDKIAVALFGDDYHADQGLVIFKESLGQLKPGIADVSEADQTIERAAFFAKKNPTWAKGTELVCIAEMTFMMPVKYAIKKLWGTQVQPSIRRFSNRITSGLLTERT